MGKKIFLLSALIFFTGLSLSLHTQEAEAKTQTGSCGKEAVWKYNDKTMILKITGKGAVSEEIKLGDDVKKIIIGEGITAINSPVVFYYEIQHAADGIKFVLPDSLKKISVRAFAGVYFQNEAITLPANLKEIESGAFWGTNLAKIKVSGKNRHFASKDGVLFTKDYKTLVCYPSEKKTKNYKLPKTVTKIRPMAFAENSHIRKVHLSKKLRKLGGGAFYDCRQLSYINLTRQSKITEITDYNGKNAFLSGLVDVESQFYNDHVEYLEKHPWTEEPMYYHFGTFEGTALKSVVIPDGITSLPCKTFMSVDRSYLPNTPKLEEITLGKNFTGEINTGDELYNENSLYLAQHTSSLKSIKVAAGNPKYMVKDNILYSKDGETLYQAFSQTGKQNLTIDSKVKRIANGAFFGLHGIKDITVKGNLESIGILAFAGKYGSSLETFTVEGNIQKIGPGAFTYSSITEFNCKKDVHSIEMNAFYFCSQLETVNLGSRLSYLGTHAFCLCVKLREITLAGSLKEIPDCAFYFCQNLTKITFPENVSCASNAFEDCNLLKEIVRIPSNPIPSKKEISEHSFTSIF